MDASISPSEEGVENVLVKGLKGKNKAVLAVLFLIEFIAWPSLPSFEI
jgi:hypothetical protein